MIWQRHLSYGGRYMSPSAMIGGGFRRGCSSNSKAGLSTSCAPDGSAQLLSYIAAHPLQIVINSPL